MSDFNQNDASRAYNNSGNQISVNTAMMTIWDSSTGAQLKISLLTNGMGIAIWMPFISPDGTRKYPSENRYSTVLNQKNAVAFERVINDHMIPAYEKGVNAKAGVFTNNARTNMIELEVRDGEFYLLMHRNCDPMTRIPKDTLRFKFESAIIVDRYNSTTGEMEVVPVQADFFVFAKAVFAYNDLAGGYVSAHGTSMANVTFNQRFMEYIRAIADSVHAQLPAPTYQTNGGYRAPASTGVQHNYNAEASVNNSVPQVIATEVTTLSDLVG